MLFIPPKVTGDKGIMSRVAKMDGHCEHSAAIPCPAEIASVDFRQPRNDNVGCTRFFVTQVGWAPRNERKGWGIPW